jgi:hypothetical protein
MTELLKKLTDLSIMRRPEACLGCGFEHGCSAHGCAAINQAIERLRLERKKAKWVKAHYVAFDGVEQQVNGCLVCSSCRDCYIAFDWAQDEDKWKFCPQCGAEMED